MGLVKGAPNLMQRLSRLPPAPNVTLIDRRKPKSLSWSHANTTFTQQTYIRWCCIDLSNAPVLTDYLEGGDTLDQFLEEYPSVSRELAVAAIEEARLSLIARLK
jgi:hypothetical protein